MQRQKNCVSVETVHTHTHTHTHTTSLRKEKGITLIALVITIVLNSSYLAMDRMNRFEKI